MDPHPFRYHFFVSYTTREDEVKAVLPLIDAFVRELERSGFTAKPPFWLDRIEIGQLVDVPDEDLLNILANAIDECIAVIAFVSPGYASSEFCRFEWNYIGNTSPSIACFEAPVIWKDPMMLDANALAFWQAMEFHPKRMTCDRDDGWQRAIGQAATFLRDCYDYRVNRWHTIQEYLKAAAWRRRAEPFFQ
jgi:hypothetical protein